MTTIRVPPVFKPLFNWPTGVEYFIVRSGRYGGKSWAVSLAILCAVHNNRHRVVVSRFTMASAKDSIKAEFSEKVSLLALDGEYENKLDRIINKEDNQETGRGIVFKGLKTAQGSQTANTKGLKSFSILVIEEAEELTDEALFDRIDLSIRPAGMPRAVILILNPATKNHFIYKRFFEAAGLPDDFVGVHGNACYILSSYKDISDRIPAADVRRLDRMETENPVKYKHVIMGAWLHRHDDVIYKNWRTGDFDESLPIVYGQDYGYSPDPDVLVKVAIDRGAKKVYVDEVFECNELSEAQIIEKTVAAVGSRPIVVDGSSKRIVSGLIGVLKRQVIFAKKYAGSVEDGIRLLQGYEIIVTPQSKGIIFELNEYHNKNGVPSDKNNHHLDAIRYCVQHFAAEQKPKLSISRAK